MTLAFQILGFTLGVMAWCLENSCTTSNYWKVRSQSEAVITSSFQYEGLWMSCAATSLGSVQCQKYKTVLGLPGYVQGCRALMIIALLLGLVSIFVSVMGMKCIKIGSTSEEAKGKTVLTGGILFILSGLSTLAAVSWYAARVVREFSDPFTPVKFELGSGLYMGWGAASLALLGGAMLCSSYKRGPPPRGHTYNYSKTTQEKQIYKAAPVSESGSTKAYV